MDGHGLLVVTGPSGVGKTTILKALARDPGGFRFSVSATTRPMRAGEEDGVDYHFMDRPRFEELRDQHGFLEWAVVHGSLYGSPRSELARAHRDGVDLILDIDPQGALQVKASGMAASYLFIAPPSLSALEQRLRGRGTEDEETLQRRLGNARGELRFAGIYDYLVVNDELPRAIAECRAVLAAERLRWRRQQRLHALARDLDRNG